MGPLDYQNKKCIVKIFDEKAMTDNSANINAFLELIRAGLWEKDSRLTSFGEIDFMGLYELAQEQAVIGLIAAGLEHVVDIKIPQQMALSTAGDVMLLEQQNRAMNQFIAELISKMRIAGIYAILVKGQGIAQCYERPLWRTFGDVDLFLNQENYRLAKEFLSLFASKMEEENPKSLHLGMTIDKWKVELHGTLRSGLWSKLERGLDETQESVFCGGNVRSRTNGDVQVFMPGVNEDVIFVFSHILQHFFIGGICLRQICDWCRLLWAYKDSVNPGIIESRMRKMALLTEWRAFASLAVNYLGYPSDGMPLYDASSKWRKKAECILFIILEVGNMGHNRDVNYQQNSSVLLRKLITLRRLSCDAYKQFLIFPKDAIIIWWKMVTRVVDH